MRYNATLSLLSMARYHRSTTAIYYTALLPLSLQFGFGFRQCRKFFFRGLSHQMMPAIQRKIRH